MTDLKALADKVRKAFGGFSGIPYAQWTHENHALHDLLDAIDTHAHELAAAKAERDAAYKDADATCAEWRSDKAELAASQAENLKLREALTELTQYGCGGYNNHQMEYDHTPNSDASCVVCGVTWAITEALHKAYEAIDSTKPSTEALRAFGDRVHAAVLQRIADKQSTAGVVDAVLGETK